MKMIMAIVPRDEAGLVLDALIAAGYAATFSESRGGMLRQAQNMLFIAVEDQKVDQVLSIIQKSCHSQILVEPSEEKEPQQKFSPGAVAAKVGGAVVFVWDMERFEIYRA